MLAPLECLSVEMKKIALLTGGTGFIGSSLALHLLKSGWDVHLLIRKSSVSIFVLDETISCHFFDGGIEELKNIIEDISPSVIFHLASFFRAEHRSDEIVAMIESNVLFGTEILEAAALCGVKNIVAAGTSWQNFSDDTYSPVCLYAATKQAFQDIAQYYVEAKGMKLITLKLFDTYGPGDTRKKLFFAIKNAAESNQPLLMSPGKQLIDMVYVDDVAAAFELAGLRLIAAQCDPSEEYVVSSGNLISLKELVGMIVNISGVKLDIEWGGRPYRDRETMLPWQNSKLLPGWSPTTSLEDGINNVFKKVKLDV
jgi:nucleoside-diphosphate-sugar epimerase